MRENDRESLRHLANALQVRVNWLKEDLAYAPTVESVRVYQEMLVSWSAILGRELDSIVEREAFEAKCREETGG